MDILRSTIVAVIILAGAAQSSLAQVIALPSTPPAQPTWISVAGALFDVARARGGDDSEFAFGNGLQTRVALERSLRRDIAVGVVGTFARLPVTIIGGTCNLCRGDATVWQGLVSARLGGGGDIGFHSVLEGVLGVTGFGNVDQDETSAGGSSPGQTIAPTVGVSYGAGYTITRGFEVNFAQEVGLIFSQGGGSGTSGGSSIARYNATRLTLRYALGQ